MACSKGFCADGLCRVSTKNKQGRGLEHLEDEVLRSFWAKLSPLVDKALPLFPDLSGLVKQRATEYVACAQVCPNWWVAVWALLVFDALDITYSSTKKTD